MSTQDLSLQKRRALTRVFERKVALLAQDGGCPPPCTRLDSPPERERGREMERGRYEREGKRGRQGEDARERVCVCVRVCVCM